MIETLFRDCVNLCKSLLGKPIFIMTNTTKKLRALKNAGCEPEIVKLDQQWQIFTVVPVPIKHRTVKDVCINFGDTIKEAVSLAYEEMRKCRKISN
jgi:hypothetical protein